MFEHTQKVTPRHLQRLAYLYVRQSSLRQVLENTESTKRQYALRQRAVALGWPREQIVVIDEDLGQSGADSNRKGFQQLVAEVGMGQAGIVMGLEVSRLARNCADWHRLLEICALSGTLILDEDGLYDPGHFNDRLLLGLKGTMSEAELHLLKARLHGGIESLARRGELRLALPIGLVYDAQGEVALESDHQIQGTVRLLFETFDRVGSACATVKAFRNQGVKFPRRPRAGPHKGELLWGELEHSQVLRALHNPRYAGAFVFGKTRTRKDLEGRTMQERLPRDEWRVVLRDAHEGYISWDTFEANQRRLLDNAMARGGPQTRQGPPREGPALLQGLVICGRCGERMTVRYGDLEGRLVAHYMCQKRSVEHAGPVCQHIPGAGIDAAVSERLLELMSPVQLDVALAVEQELQSRLEEADALRRQQVERARYEVDLAHRRYLRVDPDHRLVADALEADWNGKLRALETARADYERQCKADRRDLDDQQAAEIRALARDFPRVWNDPRTPQRERKRLVRLLIEDATLIKGEQIGVHLRFHGGATQTLTVPRSKPSWELRQTDRAVVKLIDELLDHHTDSEVAEALNHKGLRSGWGRAFRAATIARLRRSYSLRSRYERLRQAGMLTKREIAQVLDVSTDTVKTWRRRGLLKGYVCNDKGQCLYEPPGDAPPVKFRHKKPRQTQPTSDHPVEV
jgi:DNA invertase Pin-like site-specific DNA recombinase